jgi:DNA-binding transcriptional ArsR family regulator
MAPDERVQLHDLAVREHRLPTDVHRSSLFDLLLILWRSLEEDERAGSHELGQIWFDEFRTSVGDDWMARVSRFGGDAGLVWVGLAGLLTEAPASSAAEELLAWLERVDPVTLRSALLSEKLGAGPRQALDRASAGDPGGLDELLDAVPKAAAHPELVESLRRLISYPGEELAGEVASALRDLWSGPFAPHAEAWRPAIDRSAQATRLLTGSLEPSELIETVTNGITYTVPLGVVRLVLVPSVSIRPWTLVSDHQRSLVVFYPVADEHLSADPDAPPAWLVRIHKALGDDRRLRILRRVAEQESSLGDLTDLLGLAKSTVFHHIGVLRGAGLVRVRMGADEVPHYTLREGVFSEAHRSLIAYLTTATTTEGGGR